MKLLNTRGVGEQITDQVKKLKYLKSQNELNRKLLNKQLYYLFVDWEHHDFSVLQQFEEEPDECEYCDNVYPRMNWGLDKGFYVCLKCCMECENEDFESFKKGCGDKDLDYFKNK